MSIRTSYATRVDRHRLQRSIQEAFRSSPFGRTDHYPQEARPMIRFSVPCIPVAQPRQRHRVLEVRGRTFAQNYTPAKHPVNAFKAACQVAAMAVYSGPPIQGPVRLSVLFVLPRPKALVWKTRPMPRLHHITKPDTDNLTKALKDALTGLLWRDDSQICREEAVKCVASGDEGPHVEVKVSAMYVRL